MNRSLLAVLLAPGIAAGIFSVVDVILRPETYGTLTPVYFFYAYLLGLPAGAVGMAFLKKYGLMRFWHFAITGLVVGVLIGFTQYTAWPEATLAITAIGPVVGIAVWSICEWRASARRTE